MLKDNALVRDYLLDLIRMKKNDLSDGEKWTLLERMTEDLRFYSAYGLYDIIVPFLEAVHVFCKEDVEKTIHDSIKDFSDAGFIFSTLENCHKEMLFSYQRIRNMGIKPEKKAWIRALEMSKAHAEAMIWKSYNHSLINDIADSRKRNLGLWIPALYAKDVNRQYFRRLGRDFVNAIEVAIDERRKTAENRLLASLIDRQLRMLLGELRLNYCYSVNVDTFFFHMDIRDLPRLSGRELKDILFHMITKDHHTRQFRNEPDPFYDYDEDWVEAIGNICELYISESGIESYETTDILLLHVPLLYQLIDQYEKAEEQLICMLNKQKMIYTVGPLIACTIALAKTKKDRIRNWICAYLENIYSLHMKNEAIRKYLGLLDETMSFFEAYFNRVSEHVESLDEEERECTLSNMEEMLSMHSLCDEVSDMWICKNLVENDVLINALRLCKEGIQKSNNPLIDGDDHIRKSLNLFYSASSHLQNGARIDADGLLRTLNPDGGTFLGLEVFYNAQYYDAKWHESLDGRYRQIQYQMPSRKYTQRAMEAIQEFCHGYSFIRSVMISSCATISDNPINYGAYIEDQLNTEMRSLLRAALTGSGYAVCDQSMKGVGENGRRQGELDIEIRKGDLPVGIYEGLMDKGESWRKSHIDKAIRRYNFSGCRRIYIVEFCRKENFAGYWKSAIETLRKYHTVRAKETDSGLNGVRVCEGTFDWDSNGEGDFVFIGVHCHVSVG